MDSDGIGASFHHQEVNGYAHQEFLCRGHLRFSLYDGLCRAGSTLLPRLELAAGSDPQTVTWAFDGTTLAGSAPLTLTAGTHTLTAILRYSDGTTETLELALEAK